MIVPLVLLAGLVGQTTPVSSSVSLEGIIAGLSARDKAITRFSVKARFQVRLRSIYTGRMLDFASASQVSMDRPTRRFFIHKVGQVHVAPGPAPRTEDTLVESDDTLAFDGEKTLLYSESQATDGLGKPANKGKAVVRTAKVFPGRQAFWIIDPEEFLGNQAGTPLSDYLAEGPYRMVESSGDTVLLEADYGTRPWDPSGAEWRARFWIDVAKGMVCTKKELGRKNKGASRWLPYLEASAEQWFEFQPGLWLPQSYKEVHTEVSTDEAPHLITSKVTVLSDWVVNPDLPASAFRYKFPPGVVVNDSQRGSVYRTAGITDRTIAAAAKQGQDLRAEYQAAKSALGSTERRPRQWGWPIVPIVAVGVVVSVIVVWQRRRFAEARGGPMDEGER